MLNYWWDWHRNRNRRTRGRADASASDRTVVVSLPMPELEVGRYALGRRVAAEWGNHRAGRDAYPQAAKSKGRMAA